MMFPKASFNGMTNGHADVNGNGTRPAEFVRCKQNHVLPNYQALADELRGQGITPDGQTMNEYGWPTFDLSGATWRLVCLYLANTGRHPLIVYSRHDTPAVVAPGKPAAVVRSESRGGFKVVDVSALVGDMQRKVWQEQVAAYLAGAPVVTPAAPKPAPAPEPVDVWELARQFIARDGEYDEADDAFEQAMGHAEKANAALDVATDALTKTEEAYGDAARRLREASGGKGSLVIDGRVITFTDGVPSVQPGKAVVGPQTRGDSGCLDARPFCLVPRGHYFRHKGFVWQKTRDATGPDGLGWAYRRTAGTKLCSPGLQESEFDSMSTVGYMGATQPSGF